MKETMRWFGPNDPVSLRDIRQCGCEGVMTSLHHIPYGEVWSREAIALRKTELAEEHLAWLAVESVPVSEAIKTRSGDYLRHIENYKQTIRNLGAEGIDTIIYNFMPVLDWIRTDMAYALPDGSQTLHFDPVKFAVFDIHLLKRPGAEQDFPKDVCEKAQRQHEAMSDGEKRAFAATIIDVFPGMDFNFSLDDIRALLVREPNGLVRIVRVLDDQLRPQVEHLLHDGLALGRRRLGDGRASGGNPVDQLGLDAEASTQHDGGDCMHSLWCCESDVGVTRADGGIEHAHGVLP